MYKYFLIFQNGLLSKEIRLAIPTLTIIMTEVIKILHKIFSKYIDSIVNILTLDLVGINQLFYNCQFYNRFDLLCKAVMLVIPLILIIEDIKIKQKYFGAYIDSVVHIFILGMVCIKMF